VTYFDTRAKDWDSDPDKAERAARVAELIQADVPLRKEMTALEYGCGTGSLSFFLKEEFSSITLADTSRGMLNVLSEKISASDVKNMFPVRLDIVSDPLPSSRFDVIYSLMTMHHILKIETVLQKAFELLSPGGWLCIADLDAEDGSFHTEDTTSMHNGFDRIVFQKMVGSAGFREISFRTAFEINKLVDGVNRVYSVFLMIATRP
jgi:ubiquinone/menaquinone biosynthesis C-methylase UbiE